MSKKVPILYANCIPVKGAKSSIICDLQRNNYVQIPIDLYNILKNHKGLSITEIKKHYDNKYDDTIDEYFNILIDNEFAFLTDTPDLFPELSKEWHEPFKITNAIIDVGDIQYGVESVLKQLSDLNCKFIQFRYFKNFIFDEFKNLLNLLDKMQSNTIGIDFHLTYNNSFGDSKIIDFFSQNKRISSLVFYFSPKGKQIQKFEGTRYLIHTPAKLNSEKKCGIIDNSMFSINVKSYTESLKHNSCLNRKISIDTNGNIKNCPSMLQSFGNINSTTLEEALNHLDFKKYWNITKDHIEVCKDCEFRYICTDCRAYLDNPENIYSKPLKCGYDPYTNKWEEWSTNPLKQKAIEFYGMKELVKKDA